MGWLTEMVIKGVGKGGGRRRAVGGGGKKRGEREGKES